VEVEVEIEVVSSLLE
jgi:hypothetical protein